MLKVALVAIAGAAGALARYAIGRLLNPRPFPWPTLAINLTGSFVLGLLLSASVARRWPENVIVPLTIGFLGAYTTFSTFSFETYDLVRTDRTALAGLYVIASVVGGVLAAFAGYTLGRRVA
jgi:fluoride exporter